MADVESEEKTTEKATDKTNKDASAKDPVESMRELGNSAARPPEQAATRSDLADLTITNDGAAQKKLTEGEARGALEQVSEVREKLKKITNQELVKDLSNNLNKLETSLSGNSPEAAAQLKSWNSNLELLRNSRALDFMESHDLIIIPDAYMAKPSTENLSFHPANEAAWKELVAKKSAGESWTGYGRTSDYALINHAQVIAEKLEQAADLAKAGKGPELSAELIEKVIRQTDTIGHSGFSQAITERFVMAAAREDVGRAFHKSLFVDGQAEQGNTKVASYEEWVKKIYAGAGIQINSDASSTPAEQAKTIEKRGSTDGVPEMTAEEVSKVWDANPKGFVQKGYFEVAGKQVDGAKHPNGILLSSSEHPMVLQKDLPIPGQTDVNGKPLVIKAGTVLPNGVQLSAAELTPNGKTADDVPIRDLAKISLMTPAEGVKLPDGSTLMPAQVDNISVANGQEATDKSWVIQRKSIDLETGKDRVDTYVNSESKFGKNWKEVPGKPGTFAPNLDSATMLEVVQVPKGSTLKFKASYAPDGPFVIAKEGDLLKQEISEDGKRGYYRISAQDALETHIATNAATEQRLAALADEIRAKTGAEVPRAALDAKEFAEKQQSKQIEKIQKSWGEPGSTEFWQKGRDALRNQQREIYNLEVAMVKQEEAIGNRLRSLVDQTTGKKPVVEADRSIVDVLKASLSQGGGTFNSIGSEKIREVIQQEEANLESIKKSLKEATQKMDLYRDAYSRVATVDNLDSIVKADIGKAVSDFERTGSPEAVKTMILDVLRDPGAMAKFLDVIKDPVERAKAQRLVEEVRAMNAEQKAAFARSLTSEQATALKLATDSRKGTGGAGETMGRVGTVVAILALVSAAVVLAKSAGAKDVEKKKVPFFKGSGEN